MSFDSQNPRISAYVLGELEAADAAAFEAELAASDGLRQAVEDTRRTVERLAREFAGEPPLTLTDAQRQQVVHAMAQSAPSPDARPVSASGRSERRRVLPLLALAVSLLLVCGLGVAGYLWRMNGSSRVLFSLASRAAPMRRPMPLRAICRPPRRNRKRPVPAVRRRRVPRCRVRDYLSDEVQYGDASAPAGGPATAALRSDPASVAPPAEMREAAPAADFSPPAVMDPTPASASTTPLALLRALPADGPVVEVQDRLRAIDPQRPDHGVGPGFSGDKHVPITENPFRRVKDEPLSTFSIDVDTASYSKVRMYLLEHGMLPRPDAVRIEELINYFPYHYDPPADETPFAARVEVAECPWAPAHRLVRVGIKGKEVKRDQRPASNLVFLLDVSGSMDQPNKLPLLKRGMKMLVNELGENDRVAIAVYAGAAGMVLNSTPGDQKQVILDALERLQAGGSTNGGAGIQLAYQTALDHFIRGGVNRVILCTDGDFNVGVTGTDQLVRVAEQNAKTGVFLSVLGFGMGNHNDAMLEQISDKGNGNYAFIDTDAEARKVLVEQMSGTLVTIAKDVKIQVEFNPAQVGAYRLIGYENRILATEDFNDDKKDAGEIGAGHTVTALYELMPAGAGAETGRPAVDELRYQNQGQPAAAAASGELLTVKIRYKQPDGDTSTKLSFPVTDEGKRFGQASQDFRFAAAVASFGMLLRNSQHKGNATYAGVLEIAGEVRGRRCQRLPQRVRQPGRPRPADQRPVARRNGGLTLAGKASGPGERWRQPAVFPTLARYHRLRRDRPVR